MDIASRSLNLLNNLTNEIIELETRLISQTFPIDDENSIHRQFNDFYNHIQIIEKSITELLTLSKQLNNEKLIYISEQLSSRLKYLTTEINQRLKILLI